MVTRDRLIANGFTRHQIQRLIDAGILIPVHPGVYIVVHASSPLAYECAAVLACGPRALLSHRTAGRVSALPVHAETKIHVTVVGRRPRAIDGVRLHYLNELASGELTRRDGIPVASPSLTVLDIAGLGDPEELATTLNEARVQRLVTDSELWATLERHPKRRGARALRLLLERERGEPKVTRSEAERVALRLMRAHGMEPDETDYPLGQYRVDFLFRRERLVVEVDGYRYHGTRRRFVRDRRRIAALGAMGYQVFPLTWDDITRESAQAMRDLAETLEQRRRQLRAA